MSAPVDIVVPVDQAEGSTARVLRWLVGPGARVARNAPLVELETDKVTVEVAAPEEGELAEVLQGEGSAVGPGTVLGRLRSVGSTPAPPAEPAAAPTAVPTAAAVGQPARELLSPAVRRLLSEHELDPTMISGSGRGGRITRADVEAHLAQQPPAAAGLPPGTAPAVPITPSATAAQLAGLWVPHSPMRRRIAEHMARSVATAPHVTAVFEADLSAIIAHRAAQQAAFAGRDVKLTLTAYFVVASARALAAVPQVNATFHADALELHPHCNIGVGTALGNEGLIVPVIQHAETLGLYGVAERLTRLTAAARAGCLVPEDVRGGTFTISNHGVSGSLVAAPVIINQPQVAILGVGRTEKRVVVREIDGQDALLVRPMCYVSLTIDHRALDGFQANTFLAKLVETLETWPAAAR
ncbi:MAG: 2-oxo acid dehydrogenase subunit E2 [Gammaproteobacteria bacterium]|nr:2-oxo acid dehydrogenase subunit E2 [Gammaproteobacteria bacterium]